MGEGNNGNLCHSSCCAAHVYISRYNVISSRSVEGKDSPSQIILGALTYKIKERWKEKPLSSEIKEGYGE